MGEAMKKELTIRSNEINLPLESIYFGGGSPSLLSPQEIGNLIDFITKKFKLIPNVEVTLEVNPDDVSAEYLSGIKAAGINRLSLGVQSFSNRDLELMNRAHDRNQALKSLELIGKIFNNYTLDLIYGMPYSTLGEWEENINTALSFNPPHLSSYALTVEEKTALHHQIEKGIVLPLPEEEVAKQYQFLIYKMEEFGYVNYEFSNF